MQIQKKFQSVYESESKIIVKDINEILKLTKKNHTLWFSLDDGFGYVEMDKGSVLLTIVNTIERETLVFKNTPSSFKKMLDNFGDLDLFYVSPK